jgi:hypothetical protein
LRASFATASNTPRASTAVRRRDQIDAIECKWSPSAFDGTALELFRRYHPEGRNLLVTPSAEPPYPRRFGKLTVTVCTPARLEGP